MGIKIVPKTSNTRARNTVKRIKGTPAEIAADKKKKTDGKKTIGQLNQSRSITKQRLGSDKVPLIKPKVTTTKIYVGGNKKPSNAELKSELLNKNMGGGMVGGQKKLDANKDGMITGADFEMMGANRKKNGGKISYKMAGGQVVANCYD